MVRCPVCNAENYDNVNFCKECGYKLKKPKSKLISCPECGTVNFGSKYCTECGLNLIKYSNIKEWLLLKYKGIKAKENQIRFKKIREIYPNGLTFVDYHFEDIPKQDWYPPILKLIELIKSESKWGWSVVFYNLISSLKNSVFFPLITSFSGWEIELSNPIIKFNPQVEAIREFFKIKISTSDQAGGRTFDIKRRGGRWIFGHQRKRIEAYTNDDLLEMLYNFSEIGGAIPLSGWETNTNYGEKIKTFCEDYEEYLKIAYLLPPSWYILDRFKTKSWFHLLRMQEFFKKVYCVQKEV